MKFTNWIAILAAIISAGAATAAWIAAKHTRKISANGQIGAILIQMIQIFVEQPELRPYFLEEGKLPKGQEQKAKALASMLLNILETVWSMESVMTDAERTAWSKYVRYQIKSVPIVHDLYKTQKEWYAHLNMLMDDAH